MNKVTISEQYLNNILTRAVKHEAEIASYKKAVGFCLDFIESVHQDNAKITHADYCHVINQVMRFERGSE